MSAQSAIARGIIADANIESLLLVAPLCSNRSIQIQLRTCMKRIQKVRERLLAIEAFRFAEEQAKDLAVRQRFSTYSMPWGDCLIWAGVTVNEGYGQFYLDGKTFAAHRFAWSLANGPIPEGMVICHSCDTPPCVNPAHLWAGTQRDNMRDMSAKGRHRATREAALRKASVAA